MPPVRPLRIAVVALHTSPTDAPGAGDVGGMNVAVRALVEQMAELGHLIDVLTRRYSVSLPRRLELSKRITLHFVDAGPAEPRPKGDHENYIDEFAAGMSVLGDIDVVHSHHWFSGMAALPFARARGIPHVQSYHSIAAPASSALSEGERPESPGRIAGETWLAQNSDAIVAVSEAEAGTIIGRLGAPHENVTVVLPGVDTELFHPGTTQRPDRYVLTAARIEPLKGLDLAVRTIAAMPLDLRPDLIVAGGPTVGYEWHLTELHSLAGELGVADRVRFVGPLSRVELADLMRRACALLIPSHSETFGLVALEAAASGVPVLATPAGGLKESVTAQTGVMLDSRDPQEWADALGALLTDAERAAQLSASARALALTRTWRHDAEETLGVYRNAIESLGRTRDLRRPGEQS
ncbi:MAG: glycosyltransferase [Microbacteriaceae bacterium]|nr:MAG: glycosyltransferase [Microbacteriaceae bacterium]